MLEININKTNYSIVDSDVEYDQPVNSQHNVNSDHTEHVLPQYITSFKVDTVPNEFLMTEESQNKLLYLIENIERCKDHLDEINNIYNMVCEIYHNEMNKWFRSKNVKPSSHKRLKKCNKPYWCDNLQQLWNNVFEAENALFGS